MVACETNRTSGATGGRGCSRSAAPSSLWWRFRCSSTGSLTRPSLLARGTAYTLVVVNSISYRQQVTPEHLLGRVNTAGRMLSWGAGWTLGAVLGGTLGHVLGAGPALVAVASLGLVSVVVAWTSPLRRLALQLETEPVSPA